jgi:hypothetical protein
MRLMARFRSLPVPVLALAIQLIALSVALAAGMMAPIPVSWLIFGQALLAAALARATGSAWWWQCMHLIFLPTLFGALFLPVHAGWFLAASVLLALFCFGAARDRVPLYFTGRRAKAALLAQLPRRAGLRVLDAGAGWGGLVARLARARPDARVEGVENAPFSFALAWLRLRGRRNTRIAFRNLWHTPFSGCDVVYAFLSPAVMGRLWDKARAEMRPGSLFVSNSFAVPGVPPHATVDVGDLRGSRLYLWRM